MIRDRSPERTDATHEQRALRLSIVGAVVLGTTGIVWGLVSGSQIVLFDGIYAFIGVVLAWASLRAAQVVDLGPTSRYPFGREALTPLVIGAQGLVLLGTCLYASFDAVLVIGAGGTEVAASSVLAYAVLTLAGALLLVVALRRNVPDSELVGAEVSQWRAGAVLSVVMVIGFSFGLAVRDRSWSSAADYVDPVLVLVACAVILPTPFTMLKSTYRELTEATPPDAIRVPVLAGIEEVRGRFGLDEPRVRMSKLGRKLYVEVDFLVSDPSWDVAGEDDVRHAIADTLGGVGYDLWLNVDLSTDPAWGA